MKDLLLNFLSRSRQGVYTFLEPIDYLWRVLNRMGHYPPLRLRRHVGTLGALDGPGCEFAILLKLLVDLKPGQRIWDIGCGCGMLELALEESGWRGEAIGTDIHLPSINWAARTLSARSPSYIFKHADIYSKAYWSRGKMNVQQWLKEFPDKDFDLVVAKSFFTHVLPGEFDIYLSALSERLRPGGKALLTFFLLDGPKDGIETIRPPAIHFLQTNEHQDYAFKSRAAPTAAVAYSENFLRRKLAEYRLALRDDIYWGWWRGSSTGLSFQDIVIVQAGT